MWHPNLQGRCQKTYLKRNCVGAYLRSPDDSRIVVHFCTFLAFWQDRLAARATAVTPDTPHDGRGFALAIFPAIWTHTPPDGRL